LANTPEYSAIVAYRVMPSSPPDMVAVNLPIKTVSEANKREHWAIKSKRAKGQRGYTLDQLTRHVDLPASPLGVQVHLRRVGKKLLDDDNLRGALKHVRDGVADWLGIDDGKSEVQWTYSQAVGKFYGVDIMAVLEWS
jgi:hypothetical protein